MKNIARSGCLIICLLLSACAPYYHWANSDYAFSDNIKEGLLVMSVTIDPKIEVQMLKVGINDITPADSDRRKYDRGGVSLFRSDSMPERFRLRFGLFYGTMRDDLVIIKLPPGKYEISYIELSRREGYWTQYINKRRNVYQFEINDSQAVYVGNFDITVYEKKEEKQMRFEPNVRDLSEVDLPKFYETMRNIPKNLVVTDIIFAKPNTR